MDNQRCLALQYKEGPNHCNKRYLCMYIYMYVYVYVCIFIHKCTHIHIFNMLAYNLNGTKIYPINEILISSIKADLSTKTNCNC
jgi:hypothetical protein